MSPSLSSLIFSAVLGLALLVVPGFALLRLCVPARDLGFVSRLTLAPGVTTALSVLMFAWGKIFGLKFGPITPWLMIAAAMLVLLVERRRGKWRLAITVSRRGLQRITPGDWLAGLALVVILAVLLIVRFNSTLGWVVPPGLDSAHHTVIVQLLLEHHGLFDSWAPYSDAESFTYHFGFHAATALFASMSGAGALSAVFVMARVMGVCAAAALFGLVRLWTRSSWGGVFAVVFWELSSRQLSLFDGPGRWTPLAGLTILPAALVLLSLFLRAKNAATDWRLGLLCVATSAGLVLAQYKTALVFAVLAVVLFCIRCTATMFAVHPERRRRIINIFFKTFVLVVVSSILVAPRLNTIRETRIGRYIGRTLLEPPVADSTAGVATPISAHDLILSEFVNLPKATVFAFALCAALAILLRRREALWFVIGWAAVFVAMNPKLAGIDRAGLIDAEYLRYVFPSAIAAMGGLAVGLVTEAIVRPRSFVWNIAFFASALFLSACGAVQSPPMSDAARFVLREDLPVLEWIKDNVPGNEKIAGRAFIHHGIVQGYDATMWVPYFTRHLTHETLLAAALEKPPAAGWEQSTSFSDGIFGRDMSTPESARWMLEKGFRWFYAGAAPHDVASAASRVHAEADHALVEQIARNPGLELMCNSGAARLYRVR